MCDEVGIYDRVEDVVVHCVIDVRILIIVAPEHTFCFALSVAVSQLGGLTIVFYTKGNICSPLVYAP